jgi:hypothetical protein
VKERVKMISKFNYVICSIEEFNSLDTMTIDELQSLFVHEQRMNRFLRYHMKIELKEKEIETCLKEVEEEEGSNNSTTKLFFFLNKLRIMLKSVHKQLMIIYF